MASNSIANHNVPHNIECDVDSPDPDPAFPPFLPGAAGDCNARSGWPGPVAARVSRDITGAPTRGKAQLDRALETRDTGDT